MCRPAPARMTRGDFLPACDRGATALEGPTRAQDALTLGFGDGDASEASNPVELCVAVGEIALGMATEVRARRPGDDERVHTVPQQSERFRLLARH
jgi:hypothetical protein